MKRYKTLKCEKCESTKTYNSVGPNVARCACGGVMNVSERFTKEEVEMPALETASPASSVPAMSLGVKLDAGAGAMMVPELDKRYYVSDEHERLLKVINGLAARSNQNVMIVGPQGNGKTELGIWFAAKYSRPLIIMNCATIREPKDWFGYKSAREGSIFWHRSEFVKAITTPNAVIVLDEFNRLHSTVHNSLYPLLDARRCTFVEELGEVIRVAPGVVFLATCNIGMSHAGTFVMDAAVEDRFSVRVDVDYLPAKAEQDVLIKKTGVDKVVARNLVKLARLTRSKATGASATLSKGISTRQLLASAVLMSEYIGLGVPPQRVLEYTILPYYSKEGGVASEQSQVSQMINGIFAGAVAGVMAVCKACGNDELVEFALPNGEKKLKCSGCAAVFDVADAVAAAAATLSE